jgi:hypothetical protein
MRTCIGHQGLDELYSTFTKNFTTFPNHPLLFFKNKNEKSFQSSQIEFVIFFFNNGIYKLNAGICTASAINLANWSI